MNTSDIEHLEAVFAKTEAIISGVKADQLALPTPCPEFDVAILIDHLVGWITSFAARVSGEMYEGDPNAHRAGEQPSREFRAAANKILQAYHDGTNEASQLPIGMLLMEYVVHGWDLAVATGQPVPYTAAEAEAALAMGHQMLKPEYRGAGKAFGEEFGVKRGITSVEELVAFLGRNPDWAPSATT